MPRTTEMRMRMRRMLPCHDLRLTNSTTHTVYPRRACTAVLPRGQTKPNPNPSPSQTRHGQVLYALRVRSISCLGHVLDSDSDLPWLEWRLVDFNSLFHSHSPSLPLQNFTRSLRRQQRQKMRQIVRYWRHAPKCQAADKRVVSASHLSLSHVPHTYIDRQGEGRDRAESVTLHS